MEGGYRYNSLLPKDLSILSQINRKAYDVMHYKKRMVGRTAKQREKITCSNEKTVQIVQSIFSTCLYMYECHLTKVYPK